MLNQNVGIAYKHILVCKKLNCCKNRRARGDYSAAAGGGKPWEAHLLFEIILFRKPAVKVFIRKALRLTWDGDSLAMSLSFIQSSEYEKLYLNVQNMKIKGETLNTYKPNVYTSERLRKRTMDEQKFKKSFER